MNVLPKPMEGRFAPAPLSFRQARRFPALFLLLCTLASTAGALDNRDYRQGITAFSSSSYLHSYFREAYGYAVFPRIVKGGV